MLPAPLTKPKKANDLSLRASKYLIVLALVLTACINRQAVLPEGYFSQEKMAAIMTDIHLIEGARSGTLFLGDTNALPDYYARIYQKHNVTEAEFKANFTWYATYPEEMKKVYDAVLVNLSKREEEVKAKVSQEPEPADTTRDE